MGSSSTNPSAAQGAHRDSPVDNRPIDHLHESRAARIFAPSLVALSVATLIFVVVIRNAGADALVGPTLSLIAALLLLVRTRRPMHTWPEWLFARKS